MLQAVPPADKSPPIMPRRLQVVVHKAKAEGGHEVHGFDTSMRLEGTITAVKAYAKANPDGKFKDAKLDLETELPAGVSMASIPPVLLILILMEAEN